MSRAHELAQAVRDEWKTHRDFRGSRQRGEAALVELERMAGEAERLRETLRAVDGIEDALARYFADRDVPMDIRRSVDVFEAARAGEPE